MKMLVTGGNRGLGEHLVHVFGGNSASRVNGFDINHNTQEIATLSLEYDVFVNNAFDGFGNICISVFLISSISESIFVIGLTTEVQAGRFILMYLIL